MSHRCPLRPRESRGGPTLGDHQWYVTLSRHPEVNGRGFDIGATTREGGGADSVEAAWALATNAGLIRLLVASTNAWNATRSWRVSCSSACVPTTTLRSAERLLLVEMSERERHELREQLLGAGFDVTIAISRADMWLKVLTWQPHAIIADGDLAGGDISDLPRHIRASAPLVPVVLLCQQHPPRGAPAAVLLKPVSFPDLLRAVREELCGGDDPDASGGCATPGGR